MTTISGYTYEIHDGDVLVQWGTFTTDDLDYQGTDLAVAAAEIVGVHLAAMPTPPVTGEVRLWAQVTGLRFTTPPGYTGDVAALLGAS